MKRNKVVMVYPKQGFSGAYVRHMPLSLLYAASELVKHGFDVQTLDCRVEPNWQQRLRAMIDDETLCVGVSVMSGRPITHAIAIGRLVKSIDKDMPVVWGGPHATFYPETILDQEHSADYVLSGYAARSFHQLCVHLQAGKAPAQVPGLSWRDGDVSRRNGGGDDAFEFLDWRDIPYHLIKDFSVYGQVDQDRRIFSMYSAMGCPYRCSFCSSPAQYSTIPGKKWVPLSASNIVDHVQHVVEQYGANYIYFIDDDSFPKLDHVGSVIDEIQARSLPVKLGFRGARINEIKRMSDEFLDKLAAAGTDIMHIGAESGSDRILKLIRKDCTAQDIVEVNRKLARHPEITAAYNFLMGVPTETLDELKMTRDLMLRLVEDHPNCIVFPPNKFRPLPGTELYEVAQKEWNYEMPNTLEQWANIEVEGEATKGWYSPEQERFFNLMLISSYFIDNKIAKVTEGRTLFTKFARLANTLYRPIARFRLRHGLSRGLVEYWAYQILTKLHGAVSG
ncbi:B12-binding domain-containing radical SAM protein [Magnetospirillum aberrantis]|uniref:B12-binding domain-containing radical SAM protein n=1 Tax=Magnetospirillum aberrantis SpK TaxID=908842 RepID=A0A7C9UWL3_9PROT|nr:B12-binding domain-containing radical SAM protein [Magnetospirillum aberrantis SpK]